MFKHSFVAAFAALAFSGSALAQDLTGGDPEAGAKVFNKCKACHMVGEDAKNRVGPTLNGIVGMEWGKVDGFKYSSSLTEIAAAEGKRWDLATLSAYLEKPRDVIPKGRMAFAGLRKAEERADVIAYLATFGPDGATVDPVPVLEAAAGEGS